jgi:hypothetical protein
MSAGNTRTTISTIVHTAVLLYSSRKQRRTPENSLLDAANEKKKKTPSK